MKYKGKILLAWGVLLAIPLLGFYLQEQINDLCSQMEALLDQSYATLTSQPLEKAADLWGQHQVLLTMLVTHEEVDAVTKSLGRALAFLQADNTEEFYAALGETADDLRVVRLFDRLSLRSIF